MMNLTSRIKTRHIQLEQLNETFTSLKNFQNTTSYFHIYWVFLNLKLPGFHKLRTRTRKNNNRGGVGLFIKESHNYTIGDDLSVFIPHIFQSLFSEINSTTNNTSDSIVIDIYRANTQPRPDIDIFPPH
jgi:hypothetical protein